MTPRWAPVWLVFVLSVSLGTARAQVAAVSRGAAVGLGAGAVPRLGITTFSVPAAVGPPPLCGTGRRYPTLYGAWGPIPSGPSAPTLTVLGGVGAGAYSPPIPPLSRILPLEMDHEPAPPLAPLPPAPGVPIDLSRSIAPTRRGDSERAGRMMTFGDRLFRAGNLHKAEERWEQAVAADPRSAEPRLRLAELALVRGDYGEAANRLREAQAADPSWLRKAPDIEGIFGEPRTFHEQIARLEAHLQARPEDRDAWLVLGAQWLLSGREQQARNIFLRLSDRKGLDPTLAAFLTASDPPPQAEGPQRK